MNANPQADRDTGELIACEAAEARAARLEADAARYWHVRERGRLPVRTVSGYHFPDGTCNPTSYPSVDECIDAARSAVSGEPMDFTDYRREHDHGAER